MSFLAKPGIKAIKFLYLTTLISLLQSVVNVTMVFGQDHQSESKKTILVGIQQENPSFFIETSSVILLTEEDFNQGHYVNVWQLIQGRAPGMYITLDGGAPGAAGYASMHNTSGQPLLILDGLPQDIRFADGMRNPLNFLNPADIEYILIITDAAQKTMFGGRGGNGVIVIGTKRAQKNSPLYVQYDANGSVTQPGSFVDVPDAQTFRDEITTRYSEGPDVTGMMGTASTDWQEEIFIPALSQSHNLSVGGTLATVPWRASFHVHDHSGTLKTDHLNRMGGQLNINPSLFNNHLKITLNLHTSQLDNRIAPRDAIAAAIGFDPTQPIKDEGSIFGGYYSYSQALHLYNPVAYLAQTADRSKTNTMGMQASMDYKLHFFPDVILGVAAYQQNINTTNDFTISDQAAWVYHNGGYYRHKQDDFSNNFLEARMGYNKALPGINSRISLNAGWSRQKFSHDNNSFSSNLDNNVAGKPYTFFSKDGRSTNTHMSSFTTITSYSFKDLYHISYSLSWDKSSYFSSDQDFLFQSFGAAWNIHNETYWSESFFMSRLKIYANAGQSGNINLPLNPDSYFINTNLNHEAFESFNGGADFAFSDNALTGRINYFSTLQSDVFWLQPLPPGAGIPGSIINSHDVRHNGLELSLNASVIKRDKVSLDFGVHLSTRTSKVVKMMSDDIISIHYGSYVGGSRLFIDMIDFPTQSFWVYKSGGTYSDDRIAYKTPSPEYFAGITSHLRYSQWKFSMAGTLVNGNYVYNNTSAIFGNVSRLYRNENYPLSNITSEALQLNLNSPISPSQDFIQDASFFRMDYVNLAYQFDKLWKFNFELSANLQNAFVITGYKGPYPEVPSGIDYNPYPRPRIFSLGLKLGI